MISDPVTLSVGAFGERPPGRILELVAEYEEGCEHPMAAEDSEDLAGHGGFGAVIEGECQLGHR